MIGILVESTAPRIHYGVDVSGLDYPYLRHVLKRLAWVSPELRGPILKTVLEAEQSGLPRVYTKEGALRVKTMYKVDLMGVDPEYIRKKLASKREEKGRKLTWAEKQATTERLVGKHREPIPPSELPYTGSLSPTGRTPPPGWRQVKGGWQPPAAGKAGGGYYTGQKRPPSGGFVTTGTGERRGLVGLEGLGLGLNLGYLLYENAPPEAYNTLGGSEDDVAEWSALVSDLTALENSIRSAASTAPSGSALAKNGPAYAQALMRAREQLVFPQMEGYIRAGGNTASNMMKMVRSFRDLHDSRRALYEADARDSSGSASMDLAQQEYTAAVANSAKAEERAVFWEKVTDVNNPFSAVGLLGNVKTLALVALGIGALVLLLPTIGKMVGGYQKARAGA